MGNPEAKPVFTRQEARDFVRAVLCTIDDKQGFIDGVVVMAPLPWINDTETYDRYRKALVNCVNAAVASKGMDSDDRPRAHQLLSNIHRVWIDLSAQSVDPIEPATVRQRLVEEGIVRLKPPATPVTPQSLKEIKTNPFNLKRGFGVRWVRSS